MDVPSPKNQLAWMTSTAVEMFYLHLLLELLVGKKNQKNKSTQQRCQKKTYLLFVKNPEVIFVVPARGGKWKRRKKITIIKLIRQKTKNF